LWRLKVVDEGFGCGGFVVVIEIEDEV